MAGRHIEIKLLRTFLAVAEACSFAEGGRRIGVPQPTVSFHVKTLEDRLGARLFDRGNKALPVQLTPAGHDLLPDAEAMLRLHDRIAARFPAAGSQA